MFTRADLKDGKLQSYLKKPYPHCAEHGAGEELRSVFPWANFRVLISDSAERQSL